MNTNHKTYEFSHITDLLKVDPDRLDACLDELKTIIPLMRAAKAAELAASQPDEPQRSDQLRFPKLTWIDDGENSSELRVNGKTAVKVTVKDTGVLRFTNLEQIKTHVPNRKETGQIKYEDKLAAKEFVSNLSNPMADRAEAARHIMSNWFGDADMEQESDETVVSYFLSW